MQAAPSQGQGRPGGASRLLFCPVGSCSSLLSLLSPASLVSIWAGRGPCWAPTAVSSAQALRLWGLAGWGLSSPPPTPSWAPPSFPLPSPWSGALAWGPSLCGGGRASPLSRVSAPLPPGGLGVPTFHPPRLQWPGAGPGGWPRASAGGAPGLPWRWSAKLSSACILVSWAS